MTLAKIESSKFPQKVVFSPPLVWYCQTSSTMSGLSRDVDAIVTAIFQLNAPGGSTLNSIYTVCNKIHGTRKPDVEDQLNKAIKQKMVEPARRAFVLSAKARKLCEKVQRAKDFKLAAAKKLKSQKLKAQQEKLKAEMKRQNDEEKALKRAKDNQKKSKAMAAKKCPCAAVKCTRRSDIFL